MLHGLLAGGRTEATSETFGLYFSGRKVLEGILGDLDAFHGLEEANEILFTGVSGGSVGVAHYLDRMAARYPNARVTGMMSSGFYFYSTHYTGPNSTLVASHGDLSEKARCLGSEGALAVPPLQQLLPVRRHAEVHRAGTDRFGRTLARTNGCLRCLMQGKRLMHLVRSYGATFPNIATT